jgi:hypothetical protein
VGLLNAYTFQPTSDYGACSVGLLNAYTFQPTSDYGACNVDLLNAYIFQPTSDYGACNVGTVRRRLIRSHVRYAVGVQTLGPKELQSINSAQRALITSLILD